MRNLRVQYNPEMISVFIPLGGISGNKLKLLLRKREGKYSLHG